jgi:hypothetical protein
MFEVFNAITEAATRLASEYGPYIAAGVLLVTVGGIALRVLTNLLPRGGPDQEGRR